MQKEDRMDSFVLAETFKYLYLLFSEVISSFISAWLDVKFLSFWLKTQGNFFIIYVDSFEANLSHRGLELVLYASADET